MKHTLDELLAVVYRFYRNAKTYDDMGPATEALVAARRQAGSEVPFNRWRAMLARLDTRFPERDVTNRSFHLAAGRFDACYSAWLEFPPATGENTRNLGFLVSILVPYYVVYRSRVTHLDPDDPASEGRPIRQEIAFTFTPDEGPYVQEIVREIEATYGGYEPMPPAVGNMIVPDVFVGNQHLGQATLFHCLFTDDW